MIYASFDAVGVAIEAASRADGPVMQDRARYIPFFETAERYIHAHKLIISGGAANLMLLGRALGPGDFFYEIRTPHALGDARALVAAFYELDPDGVGHYAHMTTDIPGAEFTLVVDERPLFRVKSLERFRGTQLADVLNPSTRPSFFARDSDGKGLPLLCMPPEVQLIGVYAALSDPSMAGEWLQLLGDEDAMRTLFAGEARERIMAVGGGSGSRGNSAASRSNSAAATRLVTALLTEFAPLTGRVLLGSYAIDVLLQPCGDGGRKAREGASERLQLATSNPFDEEAAEVGKIAARLGLNVQSSAHEPKTPIEGHLMKKLTVYLLRPDKSRVPVVDIFNAGEYGLVPFVQTGAGAATGGAGKVRQKRRSGRRRPQPAAEEEAEGLLRDGGVKRASRPAVAPMTPVGTPFVVMKFLLVDVWTIQLLHRMGAATAAYARQVLQGLVGEFDAAARAYAFRRETPEQFGEVFPVGINSHIGTHFDPVIRMKRERFQASVDSAQKGGKKRFIPPYYPARQQKTHGHENGQQPPPKAGGGGQQPSNDTLAAYYAENEEVGWG